MFADSGTTASSLRGRGPTAKIKDVVRLPSRALAGLCTALLGLTLIALPATAEPPGAVDGHVVDHSSQQVLDGQDAEVTAAIDELRSDTDLDLWVVYVDSFDGMDQQEWAAQSAQATGLGNLDLLWAVAVEDQQTGLWANEAAGLSQSQLDSADSQARDQLGSGDWAGGAVTFTNEVHSAATGGGSALTVVLVVVALAVVVGLVVLWARSRRKRSETVGARGQRQAAARPQPAPDSLEAKLAALSVAELTTRSGSALVDLDDAVRTSEQELAFAEAQFGLQATQAFRAALTSATAKLSDAFELQAQLEDATPETETERRDMLTRILTVCAAADAELDEQAEAFAHLRNLREHAPQALDDLEQRAGEIEKTLPPAELALTQLHATYPASALESLARAPEQARSLLAAAREAVTAGREELTEEDRAGAVAYARTAEDALQQAVTLIESVHTGGRELADAREKLDPAIASIRADLIDVDRLAAGDSAVQALVPRAKSAITQATNAKEGGDPIAALAEISSAEDALDEALAPRRQQVEADERAQRKLATGIQRTYGLIRSTNDYIATNRGAVGPEARTRIANASRFLQEAEAVQQHEPRRAVDLVNRAWAAASRARDLATADVQRWHAQEPMDYGGFGYAGPRGYGRYAGRRSGVNMGSLLLGGLIGSALGGGFGGGFGGSGWNGGGGLGGGGGFGGGDMGGGGAF